MNPHPRGGSGNLSDNSGLGKLLKYIRQKFYLVLLCGPMPNHIAFIMDGNRRFSKSRNMDQGGGHRVGYSALLSTLRCCYEMNVKYVTVYAFSIDNFKRNPDEVEGLMSLMLEKIEELLKEDSFVRMYNVKINFFGNLGLLKEPVKLAAENAMRTTATNTGSVLSICVAYTSTNEIVHAVNESCRDKYTKGNSNTNHCSEKERKVVTSYDIEKFLYTEECPDPDIVVRTSGETRLSNFLLWQTPFCHLQNPSVLWPDFSFKYLIWTILEYQRVYPYLTKRKRKE